MDLLFYLYILIGTIIGSNRLAKVTKDDDSSMVCIGIIGIIILWPIYLICELIKSDYE